MPQVMIAPEDNLFPVPDDVSDQDACQFAVRPPSNGSAGCLPFYQYVREPTLTQAASSQPGGAHLLASWVHSIAGQQEAVDTSAGPIHLTRPVKTHVCGVAPDEGADSGTAGAQVNPLTAYGLLDVAGLIPEGAWLGSTAAGSVLGRQVSALARHRGVPCVGLVRRAAQKQEVLASGWAGTLESAAEYLTNGTMSHTGTQPGLSDVGLGSLLGL
jgi:NADPH:quinone reductase-like Zn-dependent oxidoreductase